MVFIERSQAVRNTYLCYCIVCSQQESKGPPCQSIDHTKERLEATSVSAFSDKTLNIVHFCPGGMTFMTCAP